MLYHQCHSVTSRTHQEVVTEIVTCLSNLHLALMMAMEALNEVEAVAEGLARLEMRDP